MTPTIAILEARQHAADRRGMWAPGSDAHTALTALDGALRLIREAQAVLEHACDLVSIGHALHEAVSDVSGHYAAAEEWPAYDPHAEAKREDRRNAA